MAAEDTDAGAARSDRRGAASAIDIGTLLRHADRQARLLGQEEAAASLRRADETRQRPTLRLVIVGEFKKGKSSLANLVVGDRLSPTDPVRVTTAAVVLRHGDQHRVTLRLLAPLPDDDGDGDDEQARGDAPAEVTVTPEALDANLFGEVWLGAPVASAEVEAPHARLAGGLEIIDSPPLGGGLSSPAAAAVLRAVTDADAALFVTDASQELTAPEMEMLELVVERCSATLCVMTKTDFHPPWRLIAELDRRHLTTAGLPIELCPVSVRLAQLGRRTGDARRLQESGVDALDAWLENHLFGTADEAATRRAARLVLEVTDQLVRIATLERDLLTDPDRAEGQLADLERAEERAQQLRAIGSRWQQVLSDGVTDLTEDARHDLTQRFLAIEDEGTRMLEAGDPAEMWNDFEAWLYRRTNEEVVGNGDLLDTRAEALAQSIAELFVIEREAITAELERATDGSRLDSLRAADLEFKTMSTKDLGLTALRGSAGGMIITGMFGSVLGLVFLPAAVFATVAGAVLAPVLGRRAMRGAREAELKRRQLDATRAFSKYLRRAQIVAGKESQEHARHVHRALRDCFSQQAETIHRTSIEELKAVAGAMKRDRAGHDVRLQELDRSLHQLELIRGHARRLAGLDIAPAAMGAAR